MATKKTPTKKVTEKEASDAAKTLRLHQEQTSGLSFEDRVAELMAGTERSHMDGMRREDAERQAAAEGLKHRGR